MGRHNLNALLYDMIPVLVTYASNNMSIQLTNKIYLLLLLNNV